MNIEVSMVCMSCKTNLSFDSSESLNRIWTDFKKEHKRCHHPDELRYLFGTYFWDVRGRYKYNVVGFYKEVEPTFEFCLSETD